MIQLSNVGPYTIFAIQDELYREKSILRNHIETVKEAQLVYQRTLSQVEIMEKKIIELSTFLDAVGEENDPECTYIFIANNFIAEEKAKLEEPSDDTH